MHGRTTGDRGVGGIHQGPSVGEGWSHVTTIIRQFRRLISLPVCVAGSCQHRSNAIPDTDRLAGTCCSHDTVLPSRRESTVVACSHDVSFAYCVSLMPCHHFIPLPRSKFCASTGSPGAVVAFVTLAPISLLLLVWLVWWIYKTADLLTCLLSCSRCWIN